MCCGGRLAQVNENLAQNTLTEARMARQPSAAPVKPLQVNAGNAAATPTQQTQQDSRFLSDEARARQPQRRSSQH